VSQPFGLRNTGEGVQTSCWNNRRTRLFLRLSWSSGRARKEDAGAGALTLGTGRSEENRPHAGSRLRLCMKRRRLLQRRPRRRVQAERRVAATAGALCTGAPLLRAPCLEMAFPLLLQQLLLLEEVELHTAK
jgi:hypothetical protein